MSLSDETIRTVATAAECVPGPRMFPWPMPGRLDALNSFETYAEWQAFFLGFELRPGIPTIVTAKYDRALKLHLLAWIDFDIIKAGEIVALTTLELGLKDRYGDKVRDKRGNISFDRLLRYMVEHDDLTDEKLPMQRRCGLGSIVKRLTGEAKPTIANIRNDLAHGYPFDGLPQAGLLEVVRDLIEYAYRGMIAECATLYPQ
jgi:hypothetical protein